MRPMAIVDKKKRIGGVCMGLRSWNKIVYEPIDAGIVIGPARLSCYESETLD